MTEATINKDYLLDDQERGQTFPALQATDYQPKNSKVEIKLGFSEDSLALLQPMAIELLDVESETVFYGENEVSFYVPKTDVRWVILGRPGLFVLDKDSGEYSNLEKGVKLAGTKKITVAKLFLACVCNGELILNGDGEPQIFSLNLKSSKTALIGGAKSQPGDGTIVSLNRGLCAHYDCKGWLTHLVSISLKAVPERFTSKVSGDSTLGIKFVLDGSARVMRDDQQKAMFQLLQKPDVIELIRNPFGTKPAEGAAKESAASPANYDEIPF